MSPSRYFTTDRPLGHFLRRWWPLVGMGAFVALGFVAFLVIGGVVSDVKKTQNQLRDQANTIARNQASIRATVQANRRLSCGVSQAITANPIVRFPQFETEEAFHRRVAALRLILRLTKGIDCVAVLAPISTKAVAPEPLPGNGPTASGASGPATGSSPSAGASPAPPSSSHTPSSPAPSGPSGPPGEQGPPGPAGPPAAPSPNPPGPGGILGGVCERVPFLCR